MISSYSEDHFGDLGLLIATIVVTILVLVFGEIIPKSFAAIYPQRLAFPFFFAIKNNHANFISSGDIFKYGFKSNIKTFWCQNRSC